MAASGSTFDAARAGVRSARLLNASDAQRSFARWLAALLAIGLVALFLPWQQYISGEGLVSALRPQDRVQTVQSVIAGRIEEWYVQEGAFVTRGTPLLRISEVKESYLDPRTVQRIGEQVSAKEAGISAKLATADALQRQILAQESSLALKLEQTRNKLLQAEFAVQKDSAGYEQALVDSAIAGDQARRAELMYKDGVESLNRYQGFVRTRQGADAKVVEKRNELSKARNELLNARIELKAVQADYDEKMAKAESERQKTLADVQETRAEVAKLRQTYASLEQRQGFYRITAPQDGIVQRAIRQGIGETIKEGEAVVRIVPAAPSSAVELYVSGNDVPLLSRGRAVRLQFEGWPALQFVGWPRVAVGTFGGIVAAVDAVESRGGKFRVLVTPDPAGTPWPAQLRMGTRVYGWALLDTVRVWYELWRQLNGFPPSLTKSAPPPGALDAPADGGGK